MRHDIKHVYKAIEKLEWAHERHMEVYGAGNKDRLIGTHETSSYYEFSHGKSHRGCSVRIPNNVISKGKGYLEDRRPSANCDPYKVASAMVRTLCLENCLVEA
jgi:glutamine synthetase